MPSHTTDAISEDPEEYGDASRNAQVRRAVDIANVPALLMVLIQATGDERWLAPRYRPSRTKGLTDHDSGGLPEDVQQEIRDAATPAIIDLLDGVRPAIELPDAELMQRLMTVCMGEDVASEYSEMLVNLMRRFVGVEGSGAGDQRGCLSRPMRAIVIGTGIGGTIAAHQLGELGIEYEILEKNPEPGGTWFQNRYPGCAVDTPSHLYSMSFAKADWSMHFASRDEILAYIDSVAKDIGAYDRTRFGTEVLRATYQREDCCWELEIRSPDGAKDRIRCDVLVSAVGLLNRPKFPEVAGLERFRGPSLHTAEWDENLPIEGKRVAVVGTGASAMQLVPAITGTASEVAVFQRSPPWVAPFGKFRQEIGQDVRFLLRAVPLYHAWYWLRLFWQFGDKVIESLRVDPEWTDPARSVNARNDGHRQFFTQYILDQLGEDAERLLDAVLPTYPPFGKRILLDNGWYAALRRSDVELIAESVQEVTERGLVTTSGRHVEVDVIVWATGFKANQFLSSLEIVGEEGISLADVWGPENGRAYLGISVPGFPNLFMLGGPNSFPGSGSYMVTAEMQMDYVTKLFFEMDRRDARAVEVREEPFLAYNDLVDDLHEQMIWTHPGMDTYYRNDQGRVVFVNPFRNVEYWEMTREVDPGDYTFT